MRFTFQGIQLSIDAFRSSLAGLPKSNRWVALGDSLPWNEIECYNHRLNNGKRGAGNKPVRMIIGALLIKHKMNLSGEETILAIQKNPYMQYFVGLSEFTVINRYTNKLCMEFSLVPPVSHYKEARSAYLEVIKFKRWSKKVIRTGKSLLLTYLIRDLRSFINLIAVNGIHLFDSLNRHERTVAVAIIKMYYRNFKCLRIMLIPVQTVS